MFRMARRYDVQSDSILFANNQPYTRDSYSIAGMGETIEDMLRFCRQMYAMKVDNAEYALLTAIVIFSGNAIIRVSVLYCVCSWKLHLLNSICLSLPQFFWVGYFQSIRRS
jgi:ecdysone receptor